MQVVEDGVTCRFLRAEDPSFLKILLPKCCICRWTHANMLKHWLDLTLRFPTAQGKQWGGVGFGVPVGAHSRQGQVSLGSCYGAPLGAESPIPLLLAPGPRGHNSFWYSRVSFDVPLSGRALWLATFFTFPWTCPVKLSRSFAVNCTSSRHIAECDRIQQKSLKLPRLPPLLQLIFLSMTSLWNQIQLKHAIQEGLVPWPKC